MKRSDKIILSENKTRKPRRGKSFGLVTPEARGPQAVGVRRPNYAACCAGWSGEIEGLKKARDRARVSRCG